MNGYVYFAQADNGLIKIGWSETLTRRAQNLCVEVQQKVTLLGAMPGTRADEAAMHLRFASTRCKPVEPFGKEWFLATTEILRFVADLPPVRADQLRRPSGGASLLGLELRRRGLTQAAAAKMVGAVGCTFTRYLNGCHLPDVRLAVRIEDVFGVPVRAWCEGDDPASGVRAHHRSSA